MNVRVCFAKYGALKFIGHLDVMRFFQKANKRACIDIVFSSGYHPHQIMSFASPLSVGLTADREYMDMEVTGTLTMEEILTRLNHEMPEGFFIRSVRELPIPPNGRKKETAMSLITAADYLISLKDTADLSITEEEILDRFEAFMKQETIPFQKEIKKSGRIEEIDLKQFIFAYAASGEELLKTSTGISPISPELPFCFEEAPSFADKYNKGITLALRLSSGSDVNIKPELVMNAFLAFCQKEYKDKDWQVHRLNLYTGTVNALQEL